MKLEVNATVREVDAPADMPLLWVLRDLLGVTGVKFGCGPMRRLRGAGANDARIEATLEGAGAAVLRNDSWAEGLASSIRNAVAWVTGRGALALARSSPVNRFSTVRT